MDYAILKDFAHTISRNKIKSIEVFGNPSRDQRRVEALYDAIISGKFKTERELVRHFFNTYDVRDPRYLKLKNKLIHELTNMAFFVDVNQPAFTERAKAYYTAYRDFAAANILSLRSSGRSGIYMAQLVLEQALKYEFIELAADVARMLRKDYARIANDPEKNQYYTGLHRKYEEKRRYETLALDHYETLVSYYMSKRSPNEEIHQRASAYFDELLPMAEMVDTSAFYSYTYNIGIIKYMSVNDIEHALEICNQALNILESRKNTNRGTLVNFTMQKMACYTQLRIEDHTSVREMLEYCLSSLEEGYFNWFRVHEVYFYHCTYSGNYGEALETYAKITGHSSFALLDGSHHDNWLLLGGYLHLLAKLGALPAEQVEAAVGTFRFGKFFNEIEVLAKDKEGMNIPLVLLPVLFHLAQNTFEDQKDFSVEALEKYRQRWLANDMNRRSDSFLKMLIAFAKKDFSGAAAEKKIKREWEILKNETPHVARQTFAVEVIPYEALWDLLQTKYQNPAPDQAPCPTTHFVTMK